MSAAAKARAEYETRGAGSTNGASSQAHHEPDEPAKETWSYGRPLVDWLGADEPSDDDSGDWHIRGLVARDVAQFLAGDPKVGKTMIMESWAIALAMGAADWCGCLVYGRKRTLVMPREDGERTTKVRLWQLARGAGLVSPRELEGWLEVDATSPLNLGSPEHLKKLRAACERFDVVMIDSFTTAHLGDENSVKDIAHALEPARDIAIGTKTAIVFVHHYNGKGQDNDKRGVKHRLRGSSAIAGYARHIVGVSHGPKRGQVEVASDGNLEHQIEPTVVELVNGETPAGKKTLAYRHVGSAVNAAIDSVRDEVVRVVGERQDGFPSANAIAKELGGNRKIVLGAVRLELKLEPPGRLEQRGKRIYSRTVVPGTSQNQSVPSTGTGSAPLRGAPEPEPWWSK
ncbi:MAG TPA: AAA family ATPase [Kofleriaceae bacterium]